MNLDFLDEIYKPIGKGFSEADTFMNREMPFNMSWGFPAALVAAYFGGPAVMSAMGEGAAGATAGAEGSIGSGGMNSLLSSLGLEGGSFPAQEAFQLPMQSYTPDYLNMLADYQGVDAGNASMLDRLLGNTEEGLYKGEETARQQAGKTVTEMLKKKQQQSALNQLTQSGSKMQQQNDAQQAEQNRMAQQQAMMRRGQPIDTTTALLSLLQEKQQFKQPRISLI